MMAMNIANRPANHPPRTSYWKNSRKNYRVDVSLAPGLILLIGSHLQLSWGFLSFIDYWLGGLKPDSIYGGRPRLPLFIIGAWFMGALAGSVIAAIPLRGISNRLSNYTNATILMFSGIVFVGGVVSGGYYGWIIMNMGRALAGLCNALNYIDMLKRIGDNAPATYRGVVTSKISLSIALSSLISVLVKITGLTVFGLDLDQLIGFLTIGCALAAALTIRFSRYDPMMHLIDSGREREAMDLLIKLRKEVHQTIAIRNEYNEMKAMVNEARAESHTLPNHIFSRGNRSPIIRVLQLKFVNLMASNCIIYIVSVALVTRVDIFLALVMFPMARIIMIIVPMILVDKVGRRKLYLMSTICTSVSLYALGILASVEFSYKRAVLNWATGIAGFVVISFTSMGMDLMQNIYSVEAFPLAKRTNSLAFVTFLEYSGQLVLVVIFNGPFDPFIFVCTAFICAIIVSVAGLLLYRRLPETRDLSLRECHNIFNTCRPYHSYTVKPGISTIGSLYAT